MPRPEPVSLWMGLDEAHEPHDRRDIPIELRHRFIIPGEWIINHIHSHIRFIVFEGPNVGLPGKAYVAWYFSPYPERVHTFFSELLCRYPEEAVRPCRSLLEDKHLFTQLMAHRRTIFVPASSGSPWGGLLAQLAQAWADAPHGKDFLRLWWALYVQLFGTRNEVPCNCCDARYAMHRDIVDGRPVQVMHPFFDCVSLTFRGGNTPPAALGICANCLWMVSPANSANAP